MTSTEAWNRTPFRRVWAGSMVSELGTAVSTLAMPLIALRMLSADPLEVSILTALPAAAFLLCALPFGVFVDNHDHRLIMIAADIGRALVTMAIPIAWALHLLSLPLLWAVTFVSGCLTVLFTLAYQSIIPSIVPRSGLVHANARMAIPPSVSEVLGPSIGGVVVGLIGAPLAVVFNCVTFVGSGALLSSFRVRDRPARPPRRRLLGEIRAGLEFVFTHRILRRITLCLGVTNFFVSMRTALVVVFVSKDLHASAAITGATLGAGSIGGVLGAVVGGRLIARYGDLTTLWKMKSSFGWVVILVPLGFHGAGVLVVAAGLFASSFTAMVFSIAQTSFRQSVCPPELLGRMNASIRWVIWGVMPLGAATGGVLATVADTRTALVVSAVGMAGSVVFVATREFRGSSIRQRER
ncbi:MFS transporter [Nocardia panacis]|uniref:MFS transporter n=1 Tax=Nocardia panacis TaxID=2340916 RepID=A0A3A4JVQ1_9NOCA|nr:MFS transporter [Nocardia panacis]RJO70642.1 MFS transporter [Nocardia panacis]